MTWNYRVMGFVDSDGEPFFDIHEVYYDENANPNGYTVNAVSVGSETLDGINWVLDRMREALEKPVLTPGDFGGHDDEVSVRLQPPPGFSSWLDYVVVATGAQRDINVQSLFDSSPWGRELSREEVESAIAEELSDLRDRAARTRSARTLRNPLDVLRGSVVQYHNPTVPFVADDWEAGQ